MAQFERPRQQDQRLKDPRRLQEVTRFKGVELADIETKIKGYLGNNPESNRAHAVAHFCQTDRQVSRMEAGVDILNQLSIENRGGADIRNVIVRADLNSRVERASDEEKTRSGEGRPHYQYEIAWINEPEAKKIEPKIKTPTKQPEDKGGRTRLPSSPSYEERQSRKQSEQQRRGEEQKTFKERQEIEEVIIDRIKEVGEWALTTERVKLELSDSGQAIILYNEEYIRNQDGTKRYSEVNSADGSYTFEHQTFGTSYPRTGRLQPEILEFIKSEANKLEGKEPLYKPRELDPEDIKTYYERAVKAGVIQPESNPEDGVNFYYLSSDILNLFRGGRRMNLDTGVIEPYPNARTEYATTRPIHPQFAEYLKEKKSELEKNRQVLPGKN